jgi:glyoxylase-like metal-dependent hydrolase (beta-lactamase superfamily II)
MSHTHADVISPVHHFKGARDAASPADRLREVRTRAARFREEMLAAPPVRYYRSFGLVRVPYPTKYAFLNAFSLPTPLLHIVNRLFVIQVDVGGEAEGAASADSRSTVKTVLVSPSDVQANAETPFFKRLARKFGPFQELGKRLVGPELSTVEWCLHQTGIAPEDVDFIAYDHLHTQDLRRWLGTGDKPGFFPRAKLLVMRQEWESTRGLLPPQQVWYCPHGIDGIDPAKVVLLDGDVKLGESVAILHTPGHTEGNQSFVVRTPEGLMVTSENGVGPDSYAPLASEIPGLRKHARATGMEIILNGNTLERGLDQYISMIQEKEIAGPSMRNPDFPNMVCSSELAAYFAFPGIEPTFSFGDLEFGAPKVR